MIEDAKDLQLALAEALRSKNELQTQLDALTMVGTPFLERLPIELRNEIYELLLVNPFLADEESIRPKCNFGEFIQYDLNPAILRICRQVSEEALSILYGRNTFIIGCLDLSRHPLPCPLTRHLSFWGVVHCAASPLDLIQVPGLNNVKHWRVLASAFGRQQSRPPRDFPRFSRAIC